MKIGLSVGTEHVARAPMHDRLRALLEQVATARDYGFDCVLTGQHYVSWPLQCLQPIPLLGRLAAEAGEMHLGTGILLLPLHQPVEIAEQVATLDTICNGRFIFGIGLGYVEEEFRAFGLDRRDRAGRFEEALEVIKRLWTEDVVTFHGQHFSLDRVAPTALPVQKPYPPVWIAANNHEAVRRAARLGDVWYANPHAMFSTLEQQMDIYRSAVAESSGQAPKDVVVSRSICVAETREDAMQQCQSSLEKRYQAYVQHGQDEALPPGDRFDKPFGELARDRFIIGDPEDCVRELRRYEALGFNYAVLDFQPGDMDDALAMRGLHLLGREVLPHLRQ